MRTWLRPIIASAVLAVALSRVAVADPEECRNARDEYNSARNDILYALRGYGECVANNDGRNDCSSEFARVRSAQNDFEVAVSEYDSACN